MFERGISCCPLMRPSQPLNCDHTAMGVCVYVCKCVRVYVCACTCTRMCACGTSSNHFGFYSDWGHFETMINWTNKQFSLWPFTTWLAQKALEIKLRACSGDQAKQPVGYWHNCAISPCSVPHCCRLICLYSLQISSSARHALLHVNAVHSLTTEDLV